MQVPEQVVAEVVVVAAGPLQTAAAVEVVEERQAARQPAWQLESPRLAYPSEPVVDPVVAAERRTAAARETSRWKKPCIAHSASDDENIGNSDDTKQHRTFIQIFVVGSERRTFL